MPNIFLSEYRGVVTTMSTELNSLGATTGKAISSAFNNVPDSNGFNGDLFADLELAVDYASAPTASGVIELYLLPSIDGGTTYPDGSSSVLPQASLYVGGFVVRNVNTPQIMNLRGIALPPGYYKYLVQNTTSQAFPASGSTLRHNAYQLKSL
jgi:hypothetical protein